MPRFGLASNGVYICPVRYRTGGSLLHFHFNLTGRKPAVYFCCTVLGVASTGCYPASCPVKPGLSSYVPEGSVRGHLFYLKQTILYHKPAGFVHTENHTPKQLPPMNSRIRESIGIPSGAAGTKYARNFRRRCASAYWGLLLSIPYSSGCA